MFSCFSNIFKAIKTNILGLPDTEKHFNDCDSMYNIQRKGEKGQHIYLTPKAQHTHTLIFMHGLGDTAEGYLDIFNGPMNPCSPNTKIVLLTAPIRTVTVNFGMQMTSWFDFKAFEINPDNFEQAIGVEEIHESAKMITYVLQEEVATLNNKSENVMIGGFSQGACMALHSGLQFDQTLGGIFVFSGFAFPVTKQNEKNSKIKILVSHGKEDSLLPWNKCEATFKQFLSQEHEVKWEIIGGLQHGFSEHSFTAFKNFFQVLTQ